MNPESKPGIVPMVEPVDSNQGNIRSAEGLQARKKCVGRSTDGVINERRTMDTAPMPNAYDSHPMPHTPMMKIRMPVSIYHEISNLLTGGSLA